MCACSAVPSHLEVTNYCPPLGLEIKDGVLGYTSLVPRLTPAFCITGFALAPRPVIQKKAGVSLGTRLGVHVTLC